MTVEEKCMIFLFFGIHMSYFKAEVLTVPDPCPEITPKMKVADMCRQNEAVEEREYGYDNIDSVVLRIKTQEDNCTCLVTIDNQTEGNVMYITKYNNLNSAAPLVSDCGLEIDVDYPNSENPIKPISCSNTALPLSFTLVQNGVLTLTSKIISGNFRHGYCLQIIRAQLYAENPILRVKCAAQGMIHSATDQQPTRNDRSGVQTTAITTNTLHDNTTVKHIEPRAETIIVPDPCPEIQPKTKVADMCQQNEAVEEGQYGSDQFDSVALRIQTQEDNCSCMVTIDNQTDNYVIYLAKYNNLISAAPFVSDCGLEIDMVYPNPEKPIQPISCSNTQFPFSFSLVQSGVLTLTSKIISGNFTRGYCLQIIRAQIFNSNPTLRVKCAAQGIIHSSPYQQPTSSDSSGVSTTAITTSTLQQDNTTAKQIEPRDNSSAIYIGLGCGLAGAILLFAVVIIIFCKRKTHKHHKNETVYDSATAQGTLDAHTYDGLRKNIQFLTSEHAASPEGYYSTVCVGNPQ